MNRPKLMIDAVWCPDDDINRQHIELGTIKEDAVDEVSRIYQVMRSDVRLCRCDDIKAKLDYHRFESLMDDLRHFGKLVFLNPETELRWHLAHPSASCHRQHTVRLTQVGPLNLVCNPVYLYAVFAVYNGIMRQEDLEP